MSWAEGRAQAPTSGLQIAQHPLQQIRYIQGSAVLYRDTHRQQYRTDALHTQLGLADHIILLAGLAPRSHQEMSSNSIMPLCLTSHELVARPRPAKHTGPDHIHIYMRLYHPFDPHTHGNSCLSCLRRYSSSQQ